MEAVFQPLGHDIYLLDLLEMGEAGRTCSYLIRGEKTAIVDVGSSLAKPRILAALEALGLAPEQIDYVILTHIHLDHAGGIGPLMHHLPGAQVLCHPRAHRHVVDPSRLIAGARAVYGDDLERLFGEILPVPEERVRIMNEGDTLDLGNGHFLTFYDTPGHARHHFSIHDAGAKGIFTGDTIGLHYIKALTGWDFEVIYPSTSPSEFDCQAVLNSADKLERLQPERLYHTHFGPTEPATLAFERTRKTVVAFDRIAREYFTPGASWEGLAEKLREYIRADLAEQGYQVTDLKGLEFDIVLNAKGLLLSLEREHAKQQQA
jgi:glyoxylase-like metal-dependent hydrolase (beta-lactamase superfamily II)